MAASQPPRRGGSHGGTFGFENRLLVELFESLVIRTFFLPVGLEHRRGNVRFFEALRSSPSSDNSIVVGAAPTFAPSAAAASPTVFVGEGIPSSFPPSASPVGSVVLSPRASIAAFPSTQSTAAAQLLVSPTSVKNDSFSCKPALQRAGRSSLSRMCLPAVVAPTAHISLVTSAVTICIALGVLGLQASSTSMGEEAADRRRSTLESLLTAVVAALMVASLVALWRVVSHNPGYIVEPNPVDPPAPILSAQSAGAWPTLVETVDGVNMTRVWCDRCAVWKPHRAAHCPVCDVCVRSYDHHCGILGACIGGDNYHRFVLYLAVTFTGSATAMFLYALQLVRLDSVSAISMMAITASSTTSSTSTPSFIRLLVVAVVGLALLAVTSWVGWLLGTCVYLIGKGQTQREKVKRIFAAAGSRNPFSAGSFVANWRRFLEGSNAPPLPTELQH